MGSAEGIRDCVPSPVYQRGTGISRLKRDFGYSSSAIEGAESWAIYLRIVFGSFRLGALVARERKREKKNVRELSVFRANCGKMKIGKREK